MSRRSSSRRGRAGSGLAALRPAAAVAPPTPSREGANGSAAPPAAGQSGSAELRPAGFETAGRAHAPGATVAARPRFSSQSAGGGGGRAAPRLLSGARRLPASGLRPEGYPPPPVVPRVPLAAAEQRAKPASEEEEPPEPTCLGTDRPPSSRCLPFSGSRHRWRLHGPSPEGSVCLSLSPGAPGCVELPSGPSA